jgi:hypothetical protein
VVMLLDPAFQGPFTIKDVTAGPLVSEIKKVNIFWVTLLGLAIFLLVGEMFRSVVTASLVGVATLALTFGTMMHSYFDRMLTELPAAMFILVASWLGLRFVRDRSKGNAILLGVALGLLTLVKASFLFIGIGYIILLFLIQPSIPEAEVKGRLWKPNLLRYGLIGVAFLATLTPWLLRNAYNFGAPVVTARGGDILAFRTLLAEQPLGDWFYYFSPRPLQPTVAAMVEPSPHREIVARYHDVKSNRWKVYRKRMQEQGMGFPGRMKAESWLTGEALKYYATNPGRYILSVLLFAYRGTWFLDGRPLAGQSALVLNAVVFINGLGILALVATMFWALFRRDAELAASLALAFGSFAFYSLFSHYIRRYSDPIAPFLFIALFWWIVAAGDALGRRFFNRAGRSTEQPAQT